MRSTAYPIAAKAKVSSETIVMDRFIFLGVSGCLCVSHWVCNPARTKITIIIIIVKILLLLFTRED